MAQYYKKQEFDVDSKVYDYFYLNDINNYESIYIINDIDYEKVINELKLDNVIIIGKDIVDDNPIYINLQLLNKSKIIYLKDNVDLLNDDSIKHFISNFKGIIIINIDLINYLRELNIIKEKYKINKNVYLKIDNYGIVEEINL